MSTPFYTYQQFSIISNNAMYMFKHHWCPLRYVHNEAALAVRHFLLVYLLWTLDIRKFMELTSYGKLMHWRNEGISVFWYLWFLPYSILERRFSGHTWDLQAWFLPPDVYKDLKLWMRGYWCHLYHWYIATNVLSL